VPILYEAGLSDDEKIALAIRIARERRLVAPGDVLVATWGHTQSAGGTDAIRVLTVGE